MSDPARPYSQTDPTQLQSQRELGQTVPSGAAADPQLAFLDPKFPPSREQGDIGRLGRFRVLKKLGAGGMGAVYLGYDVSLERTVALKVMLPQFAANPASRERFLREARTAAKIKSDHVVTIYEVGEEAGIPYIAMEYLLGASLERYLNTHGELPLEQVLRIARETALGLAAAHELGMVHRDIKPANLWLESPNGRVKILDFGLARVVTEDVKLTNSGEVVGTPAFMSPEQARGYAIDHRSDLFSLGSILYRLCTARMAFDGDTTMAILSSLALDTPPPMRQLNPSLPAALEPLVARLLAKNPAARFQTAREVAEALRAVEQLSAGPAVVPVAMRVEPQADAPNVWEGIEATETNLPAHPTESLPASGAASAGSGQRHPRRPAGSRLRPALLAVAALLAAGALLAGILLQSARGKILIESDDPDVELVVKKDGRVVRERTKDREIALRGGTYTVELVDPKPGVRLLASDRVELADGGTARVRVVQDPPRAPAGKAPSARSTSPDRKAAEYILSVGGSVAVAGSDEEIREAANLPAGPFTLSGCNAANTPVSDAALAVFRECPNLVGLDLRGTPVTDAGLAHFANCKKLTHLNLRGTPVTDAGLRHFRGCSDLVALDCTFTGVGDAGLAHFKDCTKLTQLSLPGTKVTDAGLAYFKDCTKLRELSLADTGIGDAGLVHFGGCTNLSQLFLDNTAVTDAGLVHLRGCTHLTDLNLRGTKVTDVGLATFQNCKALRLLVVANTRVGDTGLTPFKECKALAQLDVRETRVGMKTIDELARALPRCRIEWNRGTIEPRK